MYGVTSNGDQPAETAEIASPSKSGIGGLTIRKRPTEPPMPTFVEGDQPEGGKRGQPVSPLSNADFLTHVMRGIADGASAAICSKPGDPANGGWTAEAAGDVDRQCPVGRNNYVNCSSFVVDGDGDIEAKKERFSAFHFLVLDDVGTKVAADRLVGFKPTWEIETSPGNSQVGIMLAEPITDSAQVKQLQDAVMAANLCDPGAGGVARWVRLPNAINGKLKYRGQDGQPFECRLVRWNPLVTYTVDAIVEALGLDMTPRVTSTVREPVAANRSNPTVFPSDGVYAPAPVENPVVSALRERGLYKREIAPGKHDVTCPWVSEHTDGIDGGSAYFEPDSDHPIGGFKCQHSHGNRYRIGELLSFLGLKGDDVRGKARIDIVPGEMNRIRRAAEYTLLQQGGYYQSGGIIVVVRHDSASGDIGIERVGEPALTAALSDAADWYRFDGRSSKSVRTDPPVRTVQSVLRAQSFEYLPQLTGLSRQPFFRGIGGGLVTEPGYDKASGRYAAFEAERYQFPAPSRQAAEEALEKLNGLFDEFRFATPEDRSAALCAILTAAVRPTLPTAPAFNITASTPGSGKSYLAAVITPFTGPGVPLKVSYPVRAEEASKAMLSIFQSAPASIVFDDMQTDWMPFSAVNRALTSDTITDRVLGESRTITVSTRSLIIGTGNNVAPVRDMGRRVVTIRLHHRVETPALTKYSGRPVDAILARREEYVTAALTIIAAYQDAGSPTADVPDIASFGEWSSMCRQPLLWLGQPDPATSLIAQVQHDPDQDALGELLRAWHDAVGDKPITLRDLIDEGADHPDLEDALKELPVMERETINRGKLGWFFKRNSNRVVGGLELQSAESSKRNAWRIVVVDPG